MLSKLNIEPLALVLVFVKIIPALYGCNETALDIMDNHIKVKQIATQNVATIEAGLKSEIEQADKRYLQGMIKYHSYLSRFWNITNKFAQVSNILATVGTALSAGMDFYYRQHNLDNSSRNSAYNSASFAFCLAAFGTNLLQLVALRMYNRSEGMQVHLRKSLESENPLELFRKLEREDSENSIVRSGKESKKKKSKKNKQPKCMAIAPKNTGTILDLKSAKKKAEYEYIHRMIQRHSCLLNFWRTTNSIVDFSNVFITIGAAVTTGIDFYYRENNLSGSSKNSAYNNASLTLSVLSLGTRLLQFGSLKMYEKSERIHVHLHRALGFENSIEIFEKLEAGEYNENEQKYAITPTQVLTVVVPQITMPRITFSRSSITFGVGKEQGDNEISEIEISKIPTPSVTPEIPISFSRSSTIQDESSVIEISKSLDFNGDKPDY